MTSKQSVELLPASLWICDECGRDNFVRHRRIEPDSEEGIAYREENPKLLPEDGEFLMIPTRVKCNDCGSVFDAELLPYADY